MSALPESSEVMIYIAMTRLMLRRLAEFDTLSYPLKHPPNETTHYQLNRRASGMLPC